MVSARLLFLLNPALLLKADLELVGNFLGGLLGPTLDLFLPGKLPVHQIIKRLPNVPKP